MGRMLALALALPLAGCDALIDACWQATFEPEHGLEVANGGRSDVRVSVDYTKYVDDDEEDDLPGNYEDRHEEIDVAAGDKIEAWFPNEPLTVTIRRRSDGWILFQDHFSEHDFDDEHDRIELTVYP